MGIYEFILFAFTLSIVAADILIRLHFASERRDQSVERLLTVLDPVHKQAIDQNVRHDSEKELQGLLQVR